MQRLSRNEGWDFPSPQLQRNRSFSSDRNSMPASLASPPSVAPDPAYIAAAAASQIITSDHQSQIDDWFDENGGKVDSETAVVSSASLTLVNLFLDNLLFSILACARSTAIPALRPAVAEVLRPRLAKDAIDGADEELQEFLGGGNDDGISVFHDGLESRGKWDLNLAWRRTRLRCMVFTRLGDMEEEDEEIYIEQDRLEDANEYHQRNPRELNIISPAAAIFLTSILEFIGEHALMVAGEAAFNRREIRHLRHENEMILSQAEQVVVEDVDVEKLAFNTTLGRLWRSWKKRVRAPSISHSRPISRDFMRRRAASLSGSPCMSELGDPNHDVDHMPRSSVAETLREEQEIILPGVSSTDGRLDSNGRAIELPQIAANELNCMKGRSGMRPRSMLFYPHQLDLGDSIVPEFLVSARHRSSSLPNLKLKPYGHSAQGGVLTSAERLELALSQHANQHQADEIISSLEDESILIIDDNVTADPVNTCPNGHLEDQNKQVKSTNNPDPATSSHPNSPTLLTNLDCSKVEPILLNPDDQVGEHSFASAKDVKVAEPALIASPESNIPQIEKGDSVDDHSPYSSNSETNARYEKWKTYSLRDSLIPRPLAVMQGGEIDPPEEEVARHEKRNVTALFEIGSIPQREPEATWRKELAHRDVRLSPAKANTPPSGFEYGTAPPLTPLRELVEGAYDSSGNSSSSISVSQGVSRSEPPFNPPDLTQFTEAPIPGSSTPSNFSPTIRSQRGNKTSELRTELSSVNIAGADRAAVQRITPSPVLARDGVNPIVRTSTSSNRPLTSASGTSQFSLKIKTLIGRESTEGSRQLPLRRTSSEGSGTVSDGQIAHAPKTFNRQRSFEQLIKSDETIQYTLTPKSVRDMEVMI